MGCHPTRCLPQTSTHGGTQEMLALQRVSQGTEVGWVKRWAQLIGSLLKIGV